MKKMILIISLILIIGSSYAQELKIGASYKISVQDAKKIYHPVISTDGNYLLFTAEDYQGLKLLDLSTAKVLEINDIRGGGFSPAISYDNRYVYYRENGIIDRLNNVGVKRYDVIEKKSEEIIPLGRESINIISHNNEVFLKTEKRLVDKSKVNTPIVTCEYNTIIVNINGKESKLNPVADAHSYLWVSLSPNNKKILFVEPYKGIFTCDLNGDNLRSYGRGDNPVWLGDNFIITTKTSDDGYAITSSRLYAINAKTGNAIALTDESRKAEEATVANKSGKIAYTTQTGELYIIEVQVSE